jgi:hypothetical protein
VRGILCDVERSRIQTESEPSFGSALFESVARLANPYGAIADRAPWYAGFLRDRDALRGDFWNAITAYTLKDDASPSIPGQERLFDPEHVGG